MRKILDNAEAGFTDIIRDLPKEVSIPLHPFVILRLNDGRIRYYPDQVVISNASRLFIDVSDRYNGPPITLYMEEVVDAEV